MNIYLFPFTIFKRWQYLYKHYIGITVTLVTIYAFLYFIFKNIQINLIEKKMYSICINELIL